MVAEVAVEAHRANRRQLAQPEGRVRGFQLAQGAADVVGESLRRRLVHQGSEPLGREAVRTAGNGACGDPGLVAAVCCGEAEEDNRANQLVLVLLRPGEAELEVIPLVGGRRPNPFRCWHDITRTCWLRAERSERA